MPERIQLRRAKGWRMPENTVKVDRTTKWGNPFVARQHGVANNAHAVELYKLTLAGALPLTCGPDLDQLRAFRSYVADQLEDLRGKNLACWCRPGAPCHADVLLALANTSPGHKAEAYNSSSRKD